jgi:hypothetical protein
MAAASTFFFWNTSTTMTTNGQHMEHTSGKLEIPQIKMEIGKGNMELLQKKVKAGHKFQLTKKDIMLLLCYAWPK